MNNHSVVGAKIKGLRETKNLSIDVIAERSGLTVEQIESIENDVNLPSLGPLIKIARALGVRLGTFMDDNDALGPIVCRAEDREKDSSISFSNGATDARKHMEYHPLAQQKAGRHMEPFVIDINPEENPNFQLSDHEGEEFIYVMQGILHRRGARQDRSTQSQSYRRETCGHALSLRGSGYSRFQPRQTDSS